MQNKKWLSLASLMLAIGAAGYGLNAWFSPEPSSQALQELQDRVTALEQQYNSHGESSDTTVLAPMRGHSFPLATAKVLGSIDDPRASRRSIGEQPPPPEEIARRQALRRAQLDVDFRNERVDIDWAKPAEEALLAAASSDAIVHSGVTPSKISTECRASSCRIVTQFDADEDAEGWMNFYVLGAAQTLAKSEAVLMRRADGRIELAIYGRRP